MDNGQDPTPAMLLSIILVRCTMFSLSTCANHTHSISFCEHFVKGFVESHFTFTVHHIRKPSKPRRTCTSRKLAPRSTSLSTSSSPNLVNARSHSTSCLLLGLPTQPFPRSSPSRPNACRFRRSARSRTYNLQHRHTRRHPPLRQRPRTARHLPAGAPLTHCPTCRRSARPALAHRHPKPRGRHM